MSDVHVLVLLHPSLAVNVTVTISSAEQRSNNNGSKSVEVIPGIHISVELALMTHDSSAAW